MSPKPSSLCLQCFGLNFPDGEHDCPGIGNASTAVDSLRAAVPQRALEICANDILKEKSVQGEKLTLASRGRNTTFVKEDRTLLRKMEQGEQMLTNETLEKAKLATGVSGKTLLKFQEIVRNDVKVEPNLKNRLTSSNRLYEDMFAVEEVLVGEKSVPIVHCINTTEFFDRILSIRNSEAEDVFLRLSIDDGRSFLKITGSVVFKAPANETDLFKSSSVKRTHILAISPIKECHENIKLLLEKLDLDLLPSDLESLYSQDLKCSNIVLGLGNHRSKYPCEFCLWENGV